MGLELRIERAYPEEEAPNCWRGSVLADLEEFDLYLRGRVRARVTDSEFQSKLESDLRALATTDMATETLEVLLNSSVDPLDWEIGEALAECLLEDEFGVHWPWNENRDRKTPRASLPGADLVGLLCRGDDAVFLFGEVKTSSDANSPPRVLSGRSGMINQIDVLASSCEIQNALLTWLAARCRDTALATDFKKACQRYLQSGGKDVCLVGVLLRDTEPNNDDLRARGQKMDAGSGEQPRIRLDAWYAPRAISTWVETTMADA